MQCKSLTSRSFKSLTQITRLIPYMHQPEKETPKISSDEMLSFPAYRKACPSLRIYRPSIVRHRTFPRTDVCHPAPLAKAKLLDLWVPARPNALLACGEKNIVESLALKYPMPRNSTTFLHPLIIKVRMTTPGHHANNATFLNPRTI